MEFRLRTHVSAAEMEKKVGRILTIDDFNVRLTGATTVRKPDGQLLCIYLPGVVRDDADAAYPLLTKVRSRTNNRGLAAGVVGNRLGPAGTVWTARPVISSVLGALDPTVPRFPHCRLTAYTAKQVDDWVAMRPLWQRIAELLKQHVPDRYEAQAAQAALTVPEWVIPGTPFTSITVNNSYSTGVHKDKGDLDEGFSCLAVLRKGWFSGGHLVFPEYRVAVEMQHGDLMLMDSHSWHGNTVMMCDCGNVMLEKPCPECGAERISVVAYFRTRMVACGTSREENAKRLAQGVKV